MCIGLCRCVGHAGEDAGEGCKRKQQETDPFHDVPPFGFLAPPFALRSHAWEALCVSGRWTERDWTISFVVTLGL